MYPSHPHLCWFNLCYSHLYDVFLLTEPLHHSVKWALLINFRCVCGGCRVFVMCLSACLHRQEWLWTLCQIIRRHSILLCYVCPPPMYFHEFYKLPWAAAGSSGLLWCWYKMRVATIDCVCLSAACHSTSLCGVVWTNDNRTVMTTRATFCSFCLTHCLPIYPTD